VSPSNDPVVRLGELLAARLRRTSRLTLYEAFVVGGGHFEPDAELLDHLIQQREELSSWMWVTLGGEAHGGPWERSPEAALRDLLAPWLRERNQFLRVDGEAARRLGALYRRAIEETARVLSSPAGDARARDELRGVWEAHRGRLAGFARERLGGEPRDAVCATYPPSLQLEVLGLDPEELLGPVLDVGCSPGAALVLHLRGSGVEALGIDRDAPEGIDGVVAADWLEFGYGEGVWGTVVSHLGLSLHFLCYHLASGPAAEALALAHAEAYARVLRSLRPGGCFAYAPSLPFIEELLPASSYRCERVDLPSELEPSALIAAREETGLDLARASRVFRAA
jgi:SAM-dependent methyltransferase